MLSDDGYLSSREIDYLNGVNVPGIPNGTKDFVSESENEKVVHDFLSEIVIHTEDLIFPPIGIQGSL